MAYTSYDEIYTEKRKIKRCLIEGKTNTYLERKSETNTQASNREKHRHTYAFKSKRDLHSFALVRERERETYYYLKNIFSTFYKKIMKPQVLIILICTLQHQMKMKKN